MFAVPKIDTPNQHAADPALWKPNSQHFWSPEREGYQITGWPDGIFDGSNGGGPDSTYYSHKFEYLKSGANMSTWDGAAVNLAHVLNNASPSVDNYRIAYDGDNLFSGSNDLFHGNFPNLEGQSVGTGFVLAADFRLKRNSPVHPRPENKPIY